MAKAILTLPDGTVVSIKGSIEEIDRIMSLHEKSAQLKDSKTIPVGKIKRKSPIIGPKGRIQELKEGGFFKEKRSIADIQEKLEENGHIYAQTSLSPTLVRLVREKVLRRVKEDSAWMYVNQ
jgi:hypothetical protein